VTTEDGTNDFITDASPDAAYIWGAFPIHSRTLTDMIQTMLAQQGREERSRR
jgi:hypothetical protein